MRGASVTFGSVLRVREFRMLWLADAQSLVGDQIARVALSVLVFERTRSAAWTALAYALTFVPALFGGAVLAGLADRLPRRRLMIACQTLRAALLAMMAVPVVPLWLVCILLVAAVLTGAPFNAAESALVPVVLDGDAFVVGNALRTITEQLAQLAGFAGGGVVVALVGPRVGLLIDAITFAVSAVVLRFGLALRPAAASSARSGPTLAGYFAGIRETSAYIARTPQLRTLFGLAALAGLFVVPEGVAAPYARGVGGGSAATGLLLAAMPAGTALGAVLLTRFVSERHRRRWIGPLAVITAVPLVLCGFTPGLAVSLALWFLSGAAACYVVQVFAEYARGVPDERRGQAIGLAGSGLLAIQGLGIAGGGVLASLFGTSTAVAMAGVLELVLSLGLAVAWRRTGVGADAMDLQAGSRS